MKIHPTAIVSKKAQVPDDLEVGPYSIIGDNVKIGEGSCIGSFCVIEGNTTLGKNCKIFNGAIIGGIPQDLKYKGEKTFLEIGDNNIIREYCTFNLGSQSGAKTTVGNNNLFMAYSHIAHDCVVGNHCVIANAGTLAGHVKLEDHVVIGGLTAIHQFVKVGKFSIIGGCSKVVQDIPPFSMCDGHPARVYGLNLVGLKRAKFSSSVIREISYAFKIIFNSGLSIKSAIERISENKKLSPEITYLIDFIKNSQRGVCRGIR